jgi:hypothetical protein
MSPSVDIAYHGDRIAWKRIQDPSQDYPVDYHMAVLGCDPEKGVLDLIVKWEPNAYCHFHRHVAATTILVLQGEQHVAEIDENGNEIGRKVRKAGEYARKAGGEAHMEWGGPEGAVVFFSLQAQDKDGAIFELLDRRMNVLSAASASAMVEALGLAAG